MRKDIYTSIIYRYCSLFTTCVMRKRHERKRILPARSEVPSNPQIPENLVADLRRDFEYRYWIDPVSDEVV